jgi:hypothetical protein
LAEFSLPTVSAFELVPTSVESDSSLKPYTQRMILMLLSVSKTMFSQITNITLSRKEIETLCLCIKMTHTIFLIITTMVASNGRATL